MEDTERKGFSNPQNDNDQDNRYGNEQEEQFLRRRMAYLERMRRSHQGPGDVPRYNEMPPVPPMYGTMPPKKSKFIAVLLSFIFPGVGHFYLGLMQRGLIIIMLLALDIVAIVYFSAVDAKVNVPLIVLLALMLPVIYFFNLFDALQSTERVNHQAMYGTAEHVRQGPWLGLLLLFGGFIMLLFTVDPVWLRWFFTYAGSYAGAAALIGGGIFLLIKESRKRR
ncbi:TM2 domain-containing protein [Paenibacillus apiarius]|uniref:TM2 domain-containing protein n=1 Tax=Paenibacillus apiarius TaxID=46240 RepID=UPI0019810D13|nr:TM2 domain-containing protein [Paenibacillus apiarius]MBN3525389.1 TM2 domain-containing protein [Paenibacillus apiarius]